MFANEWLDVISNDSNDHIITINNLSLGQHVPTLSLTVAIVLVWPCHMWLDFKDRSGAMEEVRVKHR